MRLGICFAFTAAVLDAGAGWGQVPIADNRVPAGLLERPARLVVKDMRLPDALHQLRERAGVPVAFSTDFVPSDRRVTCLCESITVQRALATLLAGTGLSFAEYGRQVVIEPAWQRAPVSGDSRPDSWPVLANTGSIQSSTRPLVRTPQGPGNIVGKVIDAATRLPLPDARVGIKDQLTSGTTDRSGQYRLVNITAGQVIVQVRRIGYKGADQTVSVVADQTTTANFALTASVVTLENLVVSGTAGDLQRKAQPATVSDIGVSDIVTVAPVRTLDRILQGRVPSVAVSPGSGSSGVFSQIRIRGAASLVLSNEPLVYVDGIRLNSTVSTPFVADGQRTSRLGELDIKDIESIEVVKGPAAATLYGADASAGVIQIITRKGRPGVTRFTQNLTTEYDHITPNFTPPANFGLCTAALVASTSPNPLCRGQAVGALVSDNPLVREQAFVNGSSQILGWSGSGGGSNFGYYLSASYDNEDGTARNNVFDRRNGRASFNWLPSSKLSLDFDVGLLRSEIDLPDSDNNSLGYMMDGLLGSPLTRRDDGVEGNNGWQGFARDVAALSAIRNNQLTRRLISHATARFTPVPWFTNRFTVGVDWLQDEVRRFLPKNSRGSYPSLSNGGDLSEARSGTEVLTADYLGNLRITQSASLVHNFSAGFQVISNRTDRVVATGQGLTVNSNDLITATTTRSSSQDFVQQRQVGFLGQWQTGYKDRLFVQLGARLDANSAFGSESQWFFLPKAGISYLISDERWWRGSLGFINTLRLRAAYGQTGRAPTPGAALQTLSPAPYIDDAGVVQAGAVLLSPGSDTLTAERGVEIEAGFDAGFFKDRVGLEVTYFNKISRNLLNFASLPPSLGLTGFSLVNLSELRNRGFEITLTAVPVLTRRVDWDFQVGVSTLDSKITDMGGVAPFGNPNRIMQGYQPGVFITNRIRSVDVTNHRVIVSDTAEAVGNLSPTVQGSFSTNLTLFKVLRLYGQLVGKGNFYVLNLTDFFRETQTRNSNRRLDPSVLSVEERLRRFGDETPGNPAFIREGKVPGQPATANVFQVRDAYIQKGDFLRLNELSATLTLPSRWARYFGAQTATLTVAGQNLALWTSYGGVDPDVFSSAGTSFGRSDFMTIPPVRRLAVRVNAQF